jgi:hypothetical protein
MRIAFNASADSYTLRATDLLSGATAESSVRVEGPGGPASNIQGGIHGNEE